MAKPELGTKRTCPETGRKFYDLNRDPVVSPYTGISYPASAFDVVAKGRGIPSAKKSEIEDDEEVEVEVDAPDVELVALEEADPDAPGKKPVDGDDDLEIEDDDSDDTFLADDDESDDDVSDLIDSDIEDDEEA